MSPKHPIALSLRKKWIKKLLSLFVANLTPDMFTFDTLLNKAIIIENAIYINTSREGLKTHRSLYNSTLMAIYDNLDPECPAGDRFFMLLLLSLSDIELHRLASKPEIYWDSTANRTLIDVFEKNTDVIADEDIPDSKLYQCRCGSRKIPPPIQLQLRASDESGTLFFRCATCGARWKTDA